MSASRAIDRLIDARGRTVVLGAEFARGGEAALFDIAGRPELVAKLYLDQRDRATAEKLAAMIAMTNDRLSALCAWPVATLHRPGGAIAGFVMPKLTGYRPVYNVYGPKLRLRQFPRADWRFLVHTAANVARRVRRGARDGPGGGGRQPGQPVRRRRRYRPLHRHRQHAGDARRPRLALRRWGSARTSRLRCRAWRATAT